MMEDNNTVEIKEYRIFVTHIGMYSQTSIKHDVLELKFGEDMKKIMWIKVVLMKRAWSTTCSWISNR